MTALVAALKPGARFAPLLWVIIALAIAAVAVAIGGRIIAQQIVSGLMLGGIYVAVAVAFTLTIGVLNFLNFTIPTLFMLTGMVAWGLTAFGLPFGLTGRWNWFPALVAGIAVTVLASLIVERFTFRYFKAKHGDATEHAIPLVSSIGFLLVFEHLVLIVLGSETQRFPTPLRADINIAGVVIAIPQLASLALSLGVVFLLSYILKTTKTGRALRAIAESPDTATILGVDVNRIVPIVFLLTGLLCGLAGALFAINYSDVNAFMGEHVGTKAIAAMVLGGLGSIWGAIAGGLIVGLTEVLAIHFFGGEAVQIVVWSLLLFVIILRPQGLFGASKIGKGKL